MIRTGSLEGYPSLVFELGGDPADLLMRAGIRPDMLDKPDQRISTVSFRVALNLAADSLKCPRFGLMLSQRESFEKLGAIGYLARHAPDFATSVDLLNRFFRTHDTGSMPALEIADGEALWVHRLAGVSDESAIQQTELAIGLTCRFVRSVLGETWCPERVLFEHSRPPDVEIFERIFRCPVEFDQPLTALEFPESDLARPQRLSDSSLFDALLRHVKQLEAGVADNFPARVRRVIQRNIESTPIRLETVAAMLGMSRHALQSQLRAEGTNFQAELDEVRYELARRYLRETRIPIAEIAGILGYSEPAVFTRAFSRQAGTTPRNWRQSQRGTGPVYPLVSHHRT